jgi:hypothetical protein
MHHYGRQPANQAVPIWRIAHDVEDLVGPGAAPLPRPRQGPLQSGTKKQKPYEVLDVGGRPVVNREPLREKLWNAMTDTNVARSLVIVGTTDSGVTWSWWLLQHMAAQSFSDAELKSIAPEGIEAISFDLRTWIAKPAEERRAALIRTISGRLAKGTLADEWVSQVARQVSDFKEWCYQRLPANGRQWWIFVDSIDEVGDVDPNGMGEVLAALVDLADNQQLNLRLVLAGRRADQLEHGSLSWATPDSPVGLTRQEVKRWLQDKAAECGRVVDPARLESWLDPWFPTPTPTQTSQPLQLTLKLQAGVTAVSDERVG